MTSLEQNLISIVSRVERAAERVGRDAKTLRVIAVSKRQPPEAIALAYELGVREFGENYIQELHQKRTALAQLDEARWHLIGRLQRNKARHAVELAQVIHTLDSIKLVEEVSKRAVTSNVVVEAFIAVNLAQEPQKSGCSEEELPDIVAAARGSRGLKVVGLMAIPPACDNPEQVRPYFGQLREAAKRMALPRLSMGMSSDFEVAIEEGATDVRIGSALFGARD